MSERKVLTKYYPPDFDPSKIGRTKKPAGAARILPTVRLMAPFSMKCTSCGEFIYKGRKFNARKETTDEKYYKIAIIRFYIRCTRCSGEITFKTDPKNMDYECERGAKRNFEVWREAKLNEETEEERLDRLEKEEAERDAMAELETKFHDAKAEMAVADALDSIQSRNARIDKADKAGKRTDIPDDVLDEKRKREEEEDAEAARKAFAARHANSFTGAEDEVIGEVMADAKPKAEDLAFWANPRSKKKAPPPSLIQNGKITVNFGKDKKQTVASTSATAPAPAAQPSAPKQPLALLAGYDSDDD